MRAVLLDRQNTGHIGKCHIGLILQPRPQKIQILLLRVGIMCVLPEETVPFVNQDNKWAICFCINILHYLNKVIFISETYIFILVKQIIRYVLFQPCQHFIHVMRCAQKLLHIDFDHIVLIQMLPIRCFPVDF